MKGVFVTGTNTGVGKTVVSAALMNFLREKEDVCYWKPVQTGIEEDNDTETVRDLADCSADEIHDAGVRLEKPLSPHLSARIANVEITIDKVLGFVENCNDEKYWVVEGAGGVLVPINEKDLMIDLMEKLSLSVIIVSDSGLGTINHTLLTIEALRKRNLEVKGVIMNGRKNTENKIAIEIYGKVPVLAEMPEFERLNSENLNNWTKGIKLWQ